MSTHIKPLENRQNQKYHFIPDVPDMISYQNFRNEAMDGIAGTEEAFSLFLIKKGHGTHTVDGEVKEVQNRQMHFVFSGQINQWDLESGYEIDRIMISGKIFETFGSYLKYPFTHYMKLGNISLSAESFEKFQYEFINIGAEVKSGPEGQLTSEFRLKVIMLMLSKEIYRLHYEKRMNSACLLSRFITLVFEHFREQRTVSFYADKLSVTTNYLNILCNKHLGKTATGIINRELLAEIKQYLAASNVSIKELAILMNFSSITSFYAFFKKYTGMTPKEFQNQYTGINVLNRIPEDL
ncbi:AraC family transcriptional regulator [Chryseobacterium sp. Marseille-Q3244]|uniref:helix-turn-helix domain-containing protein n=1 Tax=Chryseobacterium sp. Marseille-Q3244 TaxID=2758092 RepID=UPI002024C98C|nr:AraC family transcriptional regulator [Chryseobacterium sp. Marseille-Q3244]